jgi:hypothetical protein
VPQDVIAFPPRTEYDENAALETIFARQARISLLAIDMAKLLYRARSEWIGGTVLDWDELTMGAKCRYRNEAENLIKERIV